MVICYFVSAEKTRFFIEYDRVFNGSNGFYVSPGKFWTNWLKGIGIEPKQILCLATTYKCLRRGDFSETEFDNSLTQEIQENYLRYARADRVQSFFRNKKIEKIASISITSIFNFFKENQINICLGELTWAFELIGRDIASSLGAQYFVVDSVKVPDGSQWGRFGLLFGPRLELVRDNPQGVSPPADIIRDFIHSYRSKRVGTSYLVHYDRKSFLQASALEKVSRHLKLAIEDPYDFTRPSLIRLALRKLRTVRELRLVKDASMKNPSESLPNSYVLVCLHRQPDSAIDVIAAEYSDQSEVIGRVVGLIPSKIPIVINPHPHGGSWIDLKTLKATISNDVYFLDGATPSVKLFDNALLVFSIAGTVALEAAVMGYRAQTLVPRFFSELMISQRFGEDLLELQSWEYLLSAPKPSKQRIQDYLSRIWTHSARGQFHHPNAAEEYNSKENFHNICHGLHEMLVDNSRC